MVKHQLARSANLTIKQVSHWFFNQRKKQNMKIANKHILIAKKKLKK
jgi:hypothetical protein